jgi:phage terminase large subunit-like protein
MELVVEGRLRHGANPVLTSCIANTVLVSDPAGNNKPDKDKSGKRSTTRIDGAVALLIALGTARRFIQPPPKTIDLMPFLKSPVAA